MGKGTIAGVPRPRQRMNSPSCRAGDQGNACARKDLCGMFHSVTVACSGGVMILRSGLAALASAVLCATPAAASFIVSFDYSGSATVGGVTSNLTTTTDVNNATRYFSTPTPEGGLIRDRASLINFADTSPFVFAAGAATQGTANGDATLTVKVDITNDTGAATEFVWSGLIFAGGVGFAMPQLFNGSGCTQAAIESCDAYTSTPFTVGSAELASMSFAAALAGVELFSGAMSVVDTGPSSVFSGIALNNFGAAAGNANFLEWDATNFSRSLGVFAAGETKTLEFKVIVSAITVRGFCTSQTDADCLLAMAGFGDPPGGDDGGVIQNGGGSDRSVAFSFIGPVSDVPIPPAALLFGPAALWFAARKVRRNKQPE